MNKSSWKRAWYILIPYIVYMITKTLALYLLAFIIPETIALFVDNVKEIVESNKNMLSAVVNGLASIIGVLFVIKDFAIDIRPQDVTRKDYKCSKSLIMAIKDGYKKIPDNLISYGAVISLGITASIGFNVFINLLAVQSGRYDVVEEIQYSVPLWLGIILYGIVSPVVEEIVFRGITYNRVKGFFGVWIAVLMNSMLFGMFHGNLPQFLYGTFMGILITIGYEWVGSFLAPVLMHAGANIFVFVFSTYYGYTNINSWGTFLIFAGLSVIIIEILNNIRKKKM